jgi:enamine deaminase RidA (YjgF/YER057c/UK114 family)
MLNTVISAETNLDAPAQISSAAQRGPAYGRERSLTLLPQPDESVTELFTRLADVLADTTVVQMLVFGSISASAAANEALQRQFGAVGWPVTWVEGAACDGNPIAGVQVFGFDGEVGRIRIGDRVIGSVFENGAARHCHLGGLGPVKFSATREDQTRQALERLAHALEQAGFSLADTVRTWFFLDDILSWYDEFNRARTEIYSGVKFRTGSLPASTGVGGRNPNRAALTVAAWAMKPLAGSARAGEVASPLQCPAPAYGSSFSRAMEIASPAGRRLLISGTASIAPGGETLWKNDPRRQVEQTMEVVEAILHSRGFSLTDLTRATAYFKHRTDMPAFTKWCAARGWHSPPVVAAGCAVCRDDLLLELEADAAQGC